VKSTRVRDVSGKLIKSSFVMSAFSPLTQGDVMGLVTRERNARVLHHKAAGG
jgi:hypothetical protein